MMTMTCKLTFKDGAVVTGMVSAAGQWEENRVVYTGMVERLKDKPIKTAPPMLQVIFKNEARRSDADLTVNISGEYDYEE